MKTSELFAQRAAPEACKVGYPTVSARFEWLLTTAVLWLLFGVFLDGWAHNNVPDLIETFFTPWHAVLYSGFAATVMVLVIGYIGNLKAGYHWRRGLPKPYLWSIVGVLIFSLAGNMDLIWHALFGFEEDVEALLSPSHLSLAAGGILITSTILRTKCQDIAVREYASWRTFTPLFLSFFSVLAILTFFGQFANVFTHPNLFTDLPSANDPFFYDVTLISAVLLPTALVMGFTLAFLRRWTVPFGTVTAILFGNALLMLVLNWDQSRPFSLILIAPLAAGLLGDIVLRQWQTTGASLVWWRAFSFLLPFTLFALMFAVLINGFGIWWRIHMWLGVTILAGLVGLGQSILILSPFPTAVAPWYANLLEETSRDESISF